MSGPARESELLAWIAARSAGRGPDALPLALGPGDDAALIEVPGGPTLAVTIDLQIEGVHFTREEATPARIGRKAMAASVSDVAAMGARPAHAFLSAGLPPGFTEDEAHELYASLAETAARYGATLAGGDTSLSPAGLVVDVALIGVVAAGGPVLRSSARPGDRLFVTGALGGSRGGRHLDFEPRLEEGLWLAAAGATAMIDLSDGLSTDLHRVLAASGVGARVDAARVPIAPAADGLRDALDDGEDFELLVALDPDRADETAAAWPFDVPLTEIGIATEDRDARIVGEDGRTTPLRAGGHEHSCR